MRVTIKNTFALFLLLPIAVVSTRPAFAQNAAQSPTASEKPPRTKLVLGYAYLHSSAPPGGCGCFNLSGGSADFYFSAPAFGDAMVIAGMFCSRTRRLKLVTSLASIA